MAWQSLIPVALEAAGQAQKQAQQAAPMQLLSRVDSNPVNNFGGFGVTFGEFNAAPLAGSGLGTNTLVFLVAGGVLAWLILK